MNKLLLTKKKTILVGVEGDDDKLFLEHLRKLYLTSNALFRPIILNTRGGSPVKAIIRTIKKRSTEDFEYTYVIIDSDRTEDLSEAKKIAKLENIKLILLEPLCLDCMLLSILEKRGLSTTAMCKSILKKFCGDDPFNVTNLATHFPKKLLDKRRKNVPSLNQLIYLFTGTF